MANARTKSPMRDVMMKMVGGALFGAAATGLFLFGTEGRLDHSSGATMVTVVAGLSYGLMGLLVGFGALSPSTGARFLNVEDADEIREERPRFAPSAIACALIGAFLLTVVFGTSAAQKGPYLVAAIVFLIAIVAIAIATRRNGDELIRQIGLEASALTLGIGLTILAAWAALAQLGYAGWMEPLGLVSGAALLHLVVIFAVATKRGLMRPR